MKTTYLHVKENRKHILFSSRKSYCTTPGVGVGGGGGVSKKFNVEVFYVMGKALSGKLSCPCDRSCYAS